MRCIPTHVFIPTCIFKALESCRFFSKIIFKLFLFLDWWVRVNYFYHHFLYHPMAYVVNLVVDNLLLLLVRYLFVLRSLVGCLLLV